MNNFALRLSFLFIVLTVGAVTVPGWAQTDTISLNPAAYDLAGDAEVVRLDPSERFDPQALYDLSQAGDEAALQALLTDAPSSYAATRGLILALLTEASAGFLHDYAFEGGQPDPALSGPELTALLNSPLPDVDLVQLAGWIQLLQHPDMVGAGEVAEQREFDVIALINELRATVSNFRQLQSLNHTIREAVFIASERKVQFVDTWLRLRFATPNDGASQLLTLVARDDEVDGGVKRSLIQAELDVSVGDGFSSAQYGVIYVVLKVIPEALRDTLRRVVTLKTLSPNQSPTSEIAGLYTFRQIGLKVSLSPDAMAGVFEHELGHLAWDVLLNFQQRNRYAQLHAQSAAGTIDFVSDYAQTNTSEDYAETFEAYMQDTARWLERSEANDTLREKLMFVAVALAPYAYDTTSGLSGPTVQRASVRFQNGLPDLSQPIEWVLP